MDELIRDDVSREGIRRVHVMRMGEPVSDRWRGLVPGAALETVVQSIYKEEDLDVYHLQLHWKAREVIRVGEVACVLWWVGPGGTLREAAIDAVCCHLALLGSRPDEVVVRKAPREAGERIRLALSETEEVELAVRVESWVPKGYLVVRC